MKITPLFSSIMFGVLTIMTMISCSENERDGFVSNGKETHMTVYATRDGMETETRATLNEVNGNLNCSWEEGDRLFVTSTNGNVLGQLSLVNKEEGKFEGSLVGLNEDKMALNYFYLGSGTNLEAVSESYNINIASQDGTMKSLTKNDVLSAQAEAIIIDGNAYVTGTLTLTRYFSFGHFTLTFPEGVSMNGESIAITGANLMTQASVNLADRSLSGQTAGTVTLTGTNGDFYINLIPASGVAPTFKVTIGNTEYEGTLSTRNIAAGIYLRDGGAGVPVEMAKTEDGNSTDNMVGPELVVNGKKYRFTSGNLYYNTKTGVWGIHSRQTDFTNAGGLDEKDGSGKSPELIGLFPWGATGLEDAQKPTTLREAAWQQTYDGHYFPSTDQSKNSTIKNLWENEYVYDWGRAYMENGRAANDNRQYRTPSTEIFTALMKSGFVQGATVKGGASDGSDVVGLIVIPEVTTLADAKALIRSVDGADCLSSMQAVIHNNSGNTFSYKNITLDNYDVIKRLNNAVFFPAASKRNLTSGTVYSSDGNGWYWSSTSNTTTNGYNLFFNGNAGGFAYNGTASSSSMGRFNQMAVRLLVEVE